MRLYLVSLDADFGDADGRSAWTADKSEIPALCRQLIASCFDPETRTQCAVDTVEFEPTRAGILEMLNRHATRGQAR